MPATSAGMTSQTLRGLLLFMPQSRLDRALEIILVDEAADLGGGLALRAVAPAQLEDLPGAGGIDLAARIEPLGIAHQERIVFLSCGRRRLGYFRAQHFDSSLFVRRRLEPLQASPVAAYETDGHVVIRLRPIASGGRHGSLIAAEHV